MLVKCPECESNISDKAISCPICGYPMKKQAIQPIKHYKKKRKYKRLPNGTGSIQQMSGNRQRPFALYPPTKAYNANGAAVRQQAIGYYKSWYDAYNALMEYKKTPEGKAVSTLTFAEVFNLYFDDK